MYDEYLVTCSPTAGAGILDKKPRPGCYHGGGEPGTVLWAGCGRCGSWLRNISIWLLRCGGGAALEGMAADVALDVAASPRPMMPLCRRVTTWSVWTATPGYTATTLRGAG